MSGKTRLQLSAAVAAVKIVMATIYDIKALARYIQVASSLHVYAKYTPLYPPLYSKTGVWRGIPIFLIFDPKHRLWVLIRTASRRQF